MKLIRNRILFDSNKGQKIVDVTIGNNQRTLCRGRYGGHYFQVFKEGQLPPKIIPMSDKEAFEFCQQHQEFFKTPREAEMVLKNYFGKQLPKNKKETKIPPKAQQLASINDEQLWYDITAQRFYLSTPAGVKVLVKIAALDWLEAHQGQIDPDRLEKILNTHLITSYKRP